ncbi:MAG TPA: undecaprenyl-phosphate glucose phosphotransferase [Steroidobacteraceae bacterium]|jgi:putative colanic acid biosynthesis UDP-glucose lipid carrier transferase
MTEPVLINRSIQIAFMVAVQTLTPPLIALASLFIVTQVWQVSFEHAPSTLTIVITLQFLVLTRPPRDLSEQLAWRPLIATGTVVLRWALLLLVVLIVANSTGALGLYPRHAFEAWAAGTPVALVVSTLAVGQMMRRVVTSAVGSRRVIVAGYNDSSLQLARTLESNRSLRLQVEGFFDDRASDRLNLESDIHLVGRLSEVAGFAKEHNIDVIFIALPVRHIKRVLDLLDDLRDTTASIYYVPDIFVFDLIQARSSEINGIPVVAMCETPFYGYRGLTKRLIDIAMSLAFLICALPLLLLIALLVKLSSAGPAIFRQRRYGLDGQEIIVYKFRTMTVTEDGSSIQQASRADSRITPIGRFLRRYSLDELPQFLNVLQGRMSLVGPRPHAVAHNEQYRTLIKGYMVRHKVRPGITGLAQINGARGETSKLEDMEARIRLDLEYLRRWSPLLDLQILLRTALKVFRDGQAY